MKDLLDAVGLPTSASVGSSTVTETADAKDGSADGDDAIGGEWETPMGWTILY